MTEAARTELYQQFFNAVVKGGIKPITEVAYSYFKRPMLMMSPDYTILLQMPRKPIGDPVYDGLLSHGTVPSEILAQYAVDFSDAPWMDGEIHFFDWGNIRDFPRLSKSVIIDEQVVAMASVVCASKTYTEDDTIVLDMYIDALRIEFSRKLKYTGASKPLYKSFLLALIDGDPQSIAFYLSWLKSTGVNVYPRFCVAAAKAMREVTDIVELSICSGLRQTHTHIRTLRRDGMIFILYDGIPSRQLLSEITDGLSAPDGIFYKNGYMIGISELFDDLCDFNLYRRQAERALVLGNARSQSSRLYRYSEVVALDILSCAKSSIDPEILTHEAIVTLARLDEEKNSDYSLTLRTYLETMCDPSQTCALLHIHRNSLLYRLSRIADLTGIDITDPDTHIRLLIGYKLQDF